MKFLYPCRCSIWIRNARRPDLQKETADYLYKHAILCEKHFEDNQWMNKSMKHMGLIHTATPTVFCSSDLLPGQVLKRKVRKQRAIRSELRVDGVLVKEPANADVKHNKGFSQDHSCALLSETKTTGLIYNDAEEINELNSAQNSDTNVSEQQCHKLSASIVNVGGDCLYLVVPVPPSLQ